VLDDRGSLPVVPWPLLFGEEEMNDDLLWLVVNAYHESQGETREGRIAVCHVVLNRCRQTGKSAKEVILKPKQFSWANGGARPAIKDYDALEACFGAAQECLLQRAAGDDFGGANHYFATSGPNKITPPSWSKKMEVVATIGHHTFYKG